MGTNVMNLPSPFVLLARGVLQTRFNLEEIQFEDLIVSRKGGSKGKGQLRAPPEVFENAISWVVAGIESELSTKSSKKIDLLPLSLAVHSLGSFATS